MRQIIHSIRVLHVQGPAAYAVLQIKLQMLFKVIVVSDCNRRSGAYKCTCPLSSISFDVVSVTLNVYKTL